MNTERPDFHHILDHLKCCVIIPTYDNPTTLARVIDGVLAYTNNIIIVNDGSGTATRDILAHYSMLTAIHLPTNKGKGNALRTGFNHAKEAGFNHAITIDSDGQHFPDDILIFINALTAAEDDILIIGNRNMTQLGVPKKSSFGNTFSNFWFWFETGIKLTDTQSGFRLYPLHKLPAHLYTNKFEFEIEVIVRTAWNGTDVVNVPIRVLYDHSERISHFRPFTDFTRISILNTVLVTIAIFYIKPRDVLRKLKKKGLRKFFLDNVIASNDSKLTKSLSVALGVFIGIAPFWGFQTVLVLFAAWVLKLNKVIAFAFSNISFPPLIPLIIYASLQIGGLFIAEEVAATPNQDFAFIQQNLVQYIVGSFIFATIMAILFGVAAYVAMTTFKISKNDISNA